MDCVIAVGRKKMGGGRKYKCHWEKWRGPGGGFSPASPEAHF